MRRPILLLFDKFARVEFAFGFFRFVPPDHVRAAVGHARLIVLEMFDGGGTDEGGDGRGFLGRGGGGMGGGGVETVAALVRGVETVCALRLGDKKYIQIDEYR